MDLFSLLKNDHESFASMLDCLTGGQDVGQDSIQDIQNQLAQLLRVHTKMEEQFLYPRLKGVQAANELLQDSYEEHGKVDQVLREILQQPVDSEVWAEQCKTLQGLLAHHAQEEEQKLLPIAHRVLERAEMEEIYRQMSDFRREQLAAVEEKAAYSM